MQRRLTHSSADLGARTIMGLQIGARPGAAPDLGHQASTTPPATKPGRGRSLFSGGSARCQWQRKNSWTVPSGRWSKCSTSWWEIFEPSEPVSVRLNVNVPFVSAPLALKPPQTAMWPV